MKYRNIETGAVVDVPSKLKGVWEPVEAPKPPRKKSAPKKKKSEVKDDE